MFTDDQLTAASDVLAACRKEGLLLATAESCTGGLIAGQRQVTRVQAQIDFRKLEHADGVLGAA